MGRPASTFTHNSDGRCRVREKDVERHLVEEVRRRGGIAPKLVSPGYDGMPDRLVLMDGGRMAFVELKAPGKLPRDLQLKRMDELMRLGFMVRVVDSVDKVREVLDEILAT